MSKHITKQIRFLLSSWIMAVALEYLLIPAEARPLTGLLGIRQMSGVRVICMTLGLLALWNLLRKYGSCRSAGRWRMVWAFAVYAGASILYSFTRAFLAACLLILVLLSVYAIYGWDNRPVPCPSGKETPLCAIAAALASVLFFCFVSAWTVARVRSFSSPTFDFGIFSQMFYNMKQTGLPLTTLERDGVLSHFAVHVSPIYYLMLPFYCLVPRPETLQVLQAAVLASAVLPLWKLGKQHGLSPAVRMLICFLLLLYPSYSGGTSYDLHENCFLTPLLLWLLWAIDEKNIPVMAVSAVLTLAVKEDAPVYVAVIGLYLLIRSALCMDKWGIRSGCLLLAGAVLWFGGATAYLSNYGDGVMSYRYQNFLYDGSESLLTVIQAVLLCPMKAVFECVDAQKLKFIGLTLLPLLGLPLATRRYERFVLLIPYLLVNLMSDYRYQHDIFFQYTFGSTALLFYLVTVNVADWRAGWKKYAALGLALSIALGCFCGVILPAARRPIEKCIHNAEHYACHRAMLDTIPDNVSVAATTFYTTYLSSRPMLYDIRYGSAEHVLSCAYVVIQASDAGSFRPYETAEINGKDNFTAMLLAEGYLLEAEIPDVVEIYRKIPEREESLPGK